MEVYPTLARFNAWVNQRLYAAVAELPEAQYHKDQGLFFGSVHRTLDHILVIDRLWCGRLTGEDRGIRSLDQALNGDFASLKAARTEEDARIVATVDGLGPDLDREITYRGIAGTGSYAMRVGEILMAMFNHQTHHRGQVTTVLTQCGVKYQDLDVPYFAAEQRAAGRG